MFIDSPHQPVKVGGVFNHEFTRIDTNNIIKDNYNN